MLTLVVDTSTSAVQAALVSVEPTESGPAVETLAERLRVDARGHAEYLSPFINECLAEAGHTMSDVDAVVVGVGPGPFTGLRVGMVTAAALGHARHIPTYGVCSLDGLGVGTTGAVFVATDARRKEVYWAEYRDGQRVSEPNVSKPDQLPTLDSDHALGEGAVKYADIITIPVTEGPLHPVPANLGRVAAARVLAQTPSEGLTPLYLRRPDVTMSTKHAGQSYAAPTAL